MKVQYFPQTDTLAIELRNGPAAYADDVGPDMLADYSDEGVIMGLTVEHASRHVDLGRVDVRDVAFPRLMPDAAHG